MNAMKKGLLALAIAIGTGGLASGAASAGTWYLNAAACPDLREDIRDQRYYDGRRDVREDRWDRRYIECPPRAWTYEPSRYEMRRGLQRGTGARRGTPGLVEVTRRGDYYRIDRRGERRRIDVVVEYPRYRRADHRRGYGPHRPRRYPY